MTYASTHGIAPSSKEQASYLEPALIASGMIGIRRGEKMKVETQVRLVKGMLGVERATFLPIGIALTAIGLLAGLGSIFLMGELLIGGIFIAMAIIMAFSTFILPIILGQPLRITPEHIEKMVAQARAEAIEKAKG